MNISCDMNRDLLPLYADGSCSEDSRAAVEAHLRACSACRAELERMRAPDFAETGSAPGRTPPGSWRPMEKNGGGTRHCCGSCCRCSSWRWALVGRWPCGRGTS